MDFESSDEERWVRIGRSSKSKVLVVVYCERINPERIRIISARSATKHEEKQYSFRGFL
ncbi:BrnT family toxin [uncultured Bdellovibrio sp.]|uniref:BrnT family toxin n=1 Tax=Bdellovibrio sp. HCB-162 TaxID=3394234 RepID=UPI00345CE307